MIKLNLFGRGLRLQIAITIACQMAFILFGYDQGVFGGLVGNPDWKNTFGNPGSGLEGIIVSIYNLGAFSGCIITFLFGEKLGRRLCIETSTVPMYQSELCDADKRGRLVSSEPLFVGVGIVISYFLQVLPTSISVLDRDYGMSYVGGPVSWRVPIACQVIFAFVVIFLVFGLPESPRWLYYHGRKEEALQVMCDVWDSEPDGEKVTKMQTEILEAIELERVHGEYKWRDLLKRDNVQTGRRVLLAYGMQFMNQMGGINLVVYYVPTALQYNVVFFFGSLIPTFFLDKMGRRRPMMWGSFGLAISMMLIAVLLSFTVQRGYSPATKQATSSASVAFFFTYMFIFGATANCIPWVYVPEILPQHARAKGTAVGISSNWLWNFVVVMITPTLLSHLAWKGYLIFMCTNLAFVPLVYFCYPETSNLTLEEVDHLFTTGGKHGFKEVAKMQPAEPVQQSLHVPHDDEKMVGGVGREGSREHVETLDEGKDDKSV
ncbi:hypothetical protein LTR62_006032 [Meristemomyces frigidus]|uniref:Major facilitator superfamily (MFS) profile domain-containing protein n=1 Tax=Meristemomyces frigidus TaxID=1508187 RepID=A0AAN7YS62_9PEZI|nr:hypothetical protein LTR62_006032 [Meristemomyces frigidus]